MKNTTNVWQRGTACALGGFIGIFISRQFSNDWLWTSVGLILGLLVGWVVAMFADNPKPFMYAVKDAFAEARKGVMMGNYDEEKPRITFIFGLTMGMLAIQSTVFGIFVATGSPISFKGMMINILISIAVPVVAGVFLTNGYPVTERDIANIKKWAYCGNPIGLTYYTVVNICRYCAWTWKHRAKIRHAIGVFIARMFLYFHENAGLAIITNVALALGVGHYHGYVAGVTIGFISSSTGAVIYNKGQDSLRAVVAKSS